ncbi:hypothetical protein N9O57_00320, partial [bacterium]|nr:hypothetical protein [bacterium]
MRFILNFLILFVFLVSCVEDPSGKRRRGTNFDEAVDDTDDSLDVEGVGTTGDIVVTNGNTLGV